MQVRAYRGSDASVCLSVCLSGHHDRHDTTATHHTTTPTSSLPSLLGRRPRRRATHPFACLALPQSAAIHAPGRNPLPTRSLPRSRSYLVVPATPLPGINMAQLAAAMSPSRDFSSELSFTGPAPDAFSHVASLSSTPPTTTADSISLASDASKRDATSTLAHDGPSTMPPALDEPEPSADASAPAQDAPANLHGLGTPIDTPTSERVRRHRVSAPVYNLSKLSGTADHGKRRAKGDVVADRRRRSSVRDSLLTPNADDATATADSSLVEPDQSLDNVDDTVIVDPLPPKAASSPPRPKTAKKQKSDPKPEPLRRVGTRSSTSLAQDFTSMVASLGKRSRKAFEKPPSNISRELLRLQDTNEFSGIDTQPIIHTYWANGKEVTESDPVPPKKKAKVADTRKEEALEKLSETPVEEAPRSKQPRFKKWLDRGLYAGQEAPLDIYKGLTPSEKKKLSTLPELTPSAKVNKVLPTPMYNGLRMLIEGRDFKLPFDICHPLPPGQPKPTEYKKTTKSKKTLPPRTSHSGQRIRPLTERRPFRRRCGCHLEEDPL